LDYRPPFASNDDTKDKNVDGMEDVAERQCEKKKYGHQSQRSLADGVWNGSTACSHKLC
jgi:hypothetical protein